MKKEKTPRNIRRVVINWAVPVGCGLVFLFLMKFVFFFGYVPSVSMEPTISAESFILGVRLIGELNIGDVVVFEHESHLLVKRIAALPGDEVVIHGETFTVPEEHYFMLGDNEDVSIDSRYWDDPFVVREDIVAQLLALSAW